jgi:glycosyltransferase involved in cell wall biosynthesis
MRIAYFNASLIEEQDGVSRVVYRMIRAAQERKHEVLAFSSSCPPEEERTVPMVAVASIPLPLQKGYRLAMPGYYHFSKELDAFAPDIIHTNSPCTLGFAAIAYAHSRGVPVVSTYHTHFPSYVGYYHLNSFEEVTWGLVRAHYNAVDRTFVPTRPILEELQAHGVKRLRYLPNGFDASLFNPGSRSEAWREAQGASGKLALLFLSRLVWEKDLRVLADTYEQLRAKRDDFVMVVVGDGPAREDFEKLMPGAIFLGHQSGEALSAAYASSDLFVFPSTTETFGLVTLEAMASGLVPIAADAGGASELIEHGVSGLLFPPRDADAFAREIASLMDDPDRRRSIAANAIERSKGYAWDAVLGRLFAEYAELLMHPPARRRPRGAKTFLQRAHLMPQTR